MGVIKFIFYYVCINIVFLALLIVLIGEAWILRLVTMWLFDKDLLEEVKKWRR